ncbi:MAG: redoxin family protein, partial [Byssovorax sp.]
TGDYVLKKGATLPDGLFKDACGESVRLHDLKGKYLFVEMSARNCGPCQQMAKGEEQFIADMKAKNIDVEVVTLLCPALEDTLGETTTKMLAGWIKSYKLTSPVLADRGWGLAMFEPAIGTDNVGYPSWALVDPDLKVLDFASGYGGFAEIEAAIEADAANP